MKVSRFFPILVTALALFGALAPQAARSADVLYIGDDGDNTATPPIPSSIKSFAADTGKLLGVSQGPGIMPVLAGPRGLVVDGRALLVVNQNVNLDIPGEVLRYDATTLQFLDPPNSVLQQKRGGQPRCSVRTGRPGPRGGEFSDPLPA